MKEESGAQTGKWEWIPAGAVKMGAAPGCGLPSDTNIGSPGAGGWCAGREPSWDQSTSATPSRYGSGGPPRTGAAQMLMSLVLELPGLRTQNVTRESSGENPRVRMDGLTSSGMLPWVKLWNAPEPTCVIQTSGFPSRSERSAMKWLSCETAAERPSPSNSATV